MLDAKSLRKETRGLVGSLAWILPELPSMVEEDPTVPNLEPEHARFRLFDDVLRWLDRIAEREPLAVVLEDLHWADTESLLMATAVGAGIGRTRLILLGTYRDHEVIRRGTGSTRLLADLGRSARTLALPGLRPEDAQELVSRLEVQIEPARVREIHEASGGNPFFIRELVALASRESSRGETFRVPEGVRETLRRRFADLTPDERTVLTGAAVSGGEFTAVVVSSIVGIPVERTREMLTGALELRLIRIDPQQIAGWRFTHELVRESLLAEVPSAVLADMHRRAAAALLDTQGVCTQPPFGVVAHHLLQAGDPLSMEKAVRMFVEAGRLARRGLGYEEATAHFERAIATLRALAGPLEVRLEVLLELGEARNCSGDFEGSKATFLEAVQCARRLEDSTRFAQAVIGYGTGRNQSGYIDTTLTTLLEEALGLVDAREYKLRSLLLGRLSTALYFTTESDRRLALSRESVRLARLVGDAQVLATALVYHHNILRGPATLTERTAVSAEAVAVAMDSQSPAIQCEARMASLLDHFEKGDLSTVESELGIIERTAAEKRLSHPEWHARLTRACLALRAGRMDDAEAIAASALDVPFVGSRPDAIQFYSGQIFNIRRLQGRLAELSSVLGQIIDERPHLPIWRCALLLACAEAGEESEARRQMEILAARRFREIPRDINWLSSLVTIAEACVLLQDRRRSAWIYELLLPEAGRHVVAGTQVAYLGPVRRYLGELAVCMGEVEQACEHLESALLECDAMGAPAERAKAEAALARALSERGGPEDLTRAASLRTHAIETAGTLGVRVAIDLLARSHGNAVADVLVQRSTVAYGVLRRDGETWEIRCGSEGTRLRHTKGLTYLGILLQEPGREFHALELSTAARAGGESGGVARDSGADPLLDARALVQYRERLRELREDLDAADSDGDLGRVERLRPEQAALEDEISSALGYGGRVRRFSDEAEKARVNVTRALRSVLHRIAADCPRLARHLDGTVRTGTFCSYAADPDFVTGWREG